MVSLTQWGIPYVGRKKVKTPVKQEETKKQLTTYSVENIFTGAAKPNLPVVRVGGAIPFIVGKQLISNPNLIWYGNLRPSKKTETIPSTKITTDENGVEVIHKTFTNKTTITGYLIDAQFALCLGPDVRLHRVVYNDESYLNNPSGLGRTVYPSLIKNIDVIYNSGAYDQLPDPSLVDVIPDLPGYVGISYVIMKKIPADNVGSNLSFEVSREPNPLDLSEAINKNGSDINVVSALVELITSSWGGLGYNLSDLDTSSFAQGANLAYNEGNYCSFTIGDQSSPKTVIEELCSQFDANLTIDVNTNKIALRFPRYDRFVPGQTLTVSIDNMVDNTGLRSLTKTSWLDALPGIQGTFSVRGPTYTLGSVSLDGALSPITKGKKASTDYPTVYSAELAKSLLARDYTYLSYPYFQASVEVTREFSDTKPGDIVGFDFPDGKIYSARCRVISVKKQPLGINTILLDLVQLLPTMSLTLPSVPPGQYNPDLRPKPAPAVNDVSTTYREAPYWMLKQQGLITGWSIKTPMVDQYVLLSPTIRDPNVTNYAVSVQKKFGDPWVYILKPTASQAVSLDNVQELRNISLDTLTKLMMEGALQPEVEKPSPPTVGNLSQPLGRYEGFSTGVVSYIDMEDVVLNHIPSVETLTIDEVKSGRHFILVGDEIMAYTSIEDLGGGKYRLHNVYRALIDTVAQNHAANTVVHILDNSFDYIGEKYPLSLTNTTYKWEISTWALTARTGFLVFNDWYPKRNRVGSPNRPHNTKIEGTRSEIPYPISSDQTYTISWSIRNRDALVIELQNDPSGVPEQVGSNTQKHRVYIEDSASVKHDCGLTTGSQNSLLITVPSAVAEGSGYIYVVSEIIINGVNCISQFYDKLPVTIFKGSDLTIRYQIEG